MEQKFSARPITANKLGGYIPINIPVGGGLYETRMISVSNLVSSGGNEGITLSNVTGSNKVLLDANLYLYQIVCKIQTGTPSIKIGTTLGGNDVLDTVDVSTPVLRQLFDYFTSTSTSIYITITGGYISLRLDYLTIPA